MNRRKRADQLSVLYEGQLWEIDHWIAVSVEDCIHRGILVYAVREPRNLVAILKSYECGLCCLNYAYFRDGASSKWICCWSEAWMTELEHDALSSVNKPKFTDNVYCLLINCLFLYGILITVTRQYNLVPVKGGSWTGTLYRPYVHFFCSFLSGSLPRNCS